MEKLIKGIKIASKIAEVILAISVIRDEVEKYGGKIKSTKVGADVSKEEASETSRCFNYLIRSNRFIIEGL